MRHQGHVTLWETGCAASASSLHCRGSRWLKSKKPCDVTTDTVKVIQKKVHVNSAIFKPNRLANTAMVMVGNLVVSKIFAMPKRVAEIRSYQHLLCRQSTKSDTLWGNWCRILASQVWVRLWYEQNFNRLAPRSSTYLACATFTPKLHCSTSCHASLQPSHTIAFAGQLKKLSGQETGKVHSV